MAQADDGIVGVQAHDRQATHPGLVLRYHLADTDVKPGVNGIGLFYPRR